MQSQIYKLAALAYIDAELDELEEEFGDLPQQVKDAENKVNERKALADETRQKIMALICCRQVSVNDLVDELDVAQPTVSHHLKILKNAGLVSVERRGKQVFYQINQELIFQSCCQVAEHFAPEHSFPKEDPSTP